MKPVTEPILCAAASAFDFGGPMVCDPHHYDYFLLGTL